MLVKEITYTDFDGVERKENFYFNLTRAEIVEYDTNYADHGGVMKYLTWLVKNEKINELIKAFKELILRSYGERNAQGRFIKNQEIRDSFMSTEAYSNLFMEITSSEEAAAKFINALFSGIPELKNVDLMAQAKQKQVELLGDTNITPLG